MATPTKPSWKQRLIGGSRFERALNIVTIAAIVLLLIVIALWRIPSKYQVLLPASAVSVDPKIFVAGHPPVSDRGQFFMTFVSEPDNNLLEEIFARLDPDSTIQPLPPNFSSSQNQTANTQMMLGSEQVAERVALCHLGYKNLCVTGIQLVKVESYSRAGDVLKAGDLILAIDGKSIATPDQLLAVLTVQRPGTLLKVTVERGKKQLVVKARTTSSPTTPHSTVLGIAIDPAPAPVSMSSTLPIDLSINAGDIGGPSAGLMFTLGILERLSPTDLTHGYCIAGTGTISLDGSVGAIGGVKQKVIGAEWAHARYFFVPYDQGNYAEATKYVNKHMTLVGVQTLDDALKFLRALPPNKKQGC